jgi:hypothetical protein
MVKSRRPSASRHAHKPPVRMRPLNLVARLLLEIAALVALGYWGYQMVEGGLRFALAAGIPLLAAAVWGIFAVPADPSRSGKAPVPVSGVIRLIIELAFFALAAYAMFASDMQILSLVFIIAVAAHYLISLERVRWLLAQSPVSKS